MKKIIAISVIAAMLQLSVCYAEQVLQKTIKQLAYEYAKTSDVAQKKKALEEMHGKKPATVQDLEELLKVGRSAKESLDERIALNFLYSIKVGEADKHFEASFIKVIDDPDRDIRILAIFNLGTLKSRKAAPKLREIVENFNTWEYRAAKLVSREKAHKLLCEAGEAAVSLGIMKDQQSISLLVKRFEDLEGFGAKALSKMGKAGFPYLLELARKEKDRQFAYAHRALADVDDREAKSDLIKTLTKESDPEIKIRILDALTTHMFDDDVLIVIQNLYKKEHDTVYIHPLRTNKALPFLVDTMLNDPNPRAREFSAVAIEKIGDPSSISALRKASKDRDKHVRHQAEHALSIISEKNN